MKNYFYGDDLSKKIQKLLDTHLPQDVSQNISIGDFTVLPAPEYIESYLPAVLINQTTIDVTSANKSMGVYSTPYSFDISYVYPITLENEKDYHQNFKLNTEIIANVLMNYRTLEDFIIDPSENEQGGHVIDSEVLSMTFDSDENTFFRQLEIPALISNVKYIVGFRTYAKKEVYP